MKQVRARIKEHISDPEIAESMWYAFKVGGQNIVGPSIRLAEILYSAWGNIMVGSNVARRDSGHVTAKGVAVDLETLTVITSEATVPIHGRGKDAIKTAEMRAQAVARRNATFQLIPGAYQKQAMQHAQKVYRGQSLDWKRKRMVEFFEDHDVPTSKVLDYVQKGSVDELTGADLETLRGMANKIVDESRPVGQALEAQQDEEAHERAAAELAPEEEPAGLNTLADAAGINALQMDAKKKFGKNFDKVWNATTAIAAGNHDLLRNMLTANATIVLAALVDEEPEASLLKIAAAQAKTVGT
jgi:hypothetical protein